MRLKLFKHASVIANIEDDLPKVIAYFKGHKIDIDLEVENTDVEKGDAVIGLMLPNDGKYDFVAYLYNRGAFQDVSFGLSFKPSATLSVFYLATSVADDAVDYTWKSICHELLHCIFFKFTDNGGKIPLDTMLVNNVWTPYYKNEELDAPDGNFAAAFKLLRGIILGMRTLSAGDKGEDVKTLQKALGIAQDGVFGLNTLKAVKAFQGANGLVSDGIPGPKTFAKLYKVKPKALVDVLIEVESGGNDNAEGDKTLVYHAYGCLQIRQGVCDRVNAKFGTNYKAKDCLGHREISLDIWNKYWQALPLVVTDEDRARTWNGGPGWKQIYFKTNKTKKEIQYCKNLDIYWSKVKSLL